MKYIYSFVFIIFIINVSCSNNKDSNKETLNSILGFDDTCLENGENMAFETIDIVVLEQTDESIIDYVKRVEQIDSIVLVQTSSSLFAFNKNGKFLHTYGKKGGGPEEYLSLSSFVIDKTEKTIKIVDEGSSKILKFDIKGKFLTATSYDRKKLSIWTVSGIQLNKDEMLFTNMIYNDKNTLYSLFDDKKGSWLPLFNFPVRTDNVAQPFGKTTLSFYNDTVKLLKPFDPQIYALNGAELIPIMTIQTNQKRIEPKQIEVIDNFSINTYADLSNQNFFTGFTGIYETKDFLLLDVLYGSSYFLIQKGDQSGKLYNYTLPEELNRMPLINIKSADSNYLIGVIDPMRFNSTKEKISQTTNDSNLLKLKNTLDGLNIDSNPCLLFYKIKKSD